MGKKELIRLSLVSGIVIFADQATKKLIMATLALHEQIVVIDNFFNITHVLNPGGAFGFFATQSQLVRKIVFLLLSSVVALFICWFYSRVARTHLFLSYGLALIFGGAVGNLVDRFLYGHVVDFLDLYIGTAHWPAFNVADSAISIGMVILIYHVVFKKMPDI
ncbi:MAG: signal peptidase II [Desulfotignum sp.]|nr:signal peptidase II [Desulfotignum sp.]MCF8114162.1 signal peptidase II [Desulfotignum sp.]MCF8125727.1 signal peptidase II [Desulfotignum sp.]